MASDLVLTEESVTGAVEVAGVFKGGGAKGIAYAGALEMLAEADIEFTAVAGSSAGAITAALVAAGYAAPAIAGLATDALLTIGRPATSMLNLGRSSLLAPRGLESWLDDKLATAPGAGKAGESPRVSFKDLQRRTGISLYVVGMDLRSGQPLVFCSELTPDTPVASAVVASAAIPVAFPPARFVTGGRVRRVVDGGAYANYPSFVFLDEDFRAHHGLGPAPETVVGFILDDSEKSVVDTDESLMPVGGRRFVNEGGSAARELGVLGAFVTLPLLGVILLSAVTVLGVALLEGLRGIVGSDLARLDALPGPVAFGLTVAVIASVSVGAIAVPFVAFGVVRLGRDLFDVGLVSAGAAMGVGPSVPYWVGSRDAPGSGRQIAIRIRVPDGLETLSFRPTEDLVEAALDAGRRTAWPLANRLAPHPLPPPPPSPTSAVRNDSASRWTPVGAPRAFGSRAVLLIGAWLSGLGLLGGAMYAVRALAIAESTVVWLALAGVSVLLLLACLTGLRRVEAVRDTPRWIQRSRTRLVSTAGVTMLLAVLCWGVVLSPSLPAIELANGDSYRGEVVDVEDRGSSLILDVVVALPELPEGTWQSGNTTLRRCDDDVEDCWRFGTSNVGFEEGDPVPVLADPVDAVAELEEEVWSLESVNHVPLYLAAAVLFTSMSSGALSAIRWRRRVSPTPAAAVVGTPATGHEG